MKRESALAVAAGALGAMLLVAAWKGSVFGVLLGLMLSALPLAMTALGLGLSYLPLAVIAGAVTVLVLTGSFIQTALYVVVDVAPVALLTRLGFAAERQMMSDTPGPIGGTTLGLAVASLAIAAVVVMAIGLSVYPAGPEGLEATLRAQLSQLFTEVQTARGGAQAMTEDMAQAMARVLPGAAAWNWSFRALLSTVLAQGLLARDGFARWPVPAYRTFAVPGWYIGTFWAAAFAGWLIPGDTGFIAANMAAALSFPLVLQGLAVVHCAAARLGYGRMALFAFYGIALVAAGVAVALIVILGVMEHFLNMRARMAATRNGG